jgi:hypothetical protein
MPDKALLSDCRLRLMLWPVIVLPPPAACNLGRLIFFVSMFSSLLGPLQHLSQRNLIEVSSLQPWGLATRVHRIAMLYDETMGMRSPKTAGLPG